MESRVVVPNATGVHGHMRRLAVAFDGSSLSFDGAQKEIPERSAWDSRRVLQGVGALEAWLKLWMGEHSFTVVAPVPVRSTR